MNRPKLFVRLLLCLQVLPLAAAQGQLDGSHPARAGAELPTVDLDQFVWSVDSEALQAQGPGSRVRFAADGASLELSPPAGAASELRLRYQGFARGRQRSATPAPVAAGRSENVVSYPRQGLVETYTVKGLGFEQSFVLHAPIAGRGDLVIEIGVSGNVQSPRRELLHQPLQFEAQDGQAIRYGEAIAFDRTGQRVEVQTAYDGVGRISLSVPGAFLDAATYPVVVDPIVGPLMRASSYAGLTQSVPDVAIHPETGDQMMVWVSISGASSWLCAQRFDAAGVALGPTLLSAPQPAHHYREPSVAYSVGFGGGWLVAYTEPVSAAEPPIGGRRRVAARSIASNGATFGLPSVVSVPPAGQSDRNPTVTSQDRFLAHHFKFERGDAGGESAQLLVLTPQGLLVLHDMGANYPARYLRNSSISETPIAYTVAGVDASGCRVVWEEWWPLPAPGDYDVYTAAYEVTLGAAPVETQARVAVSEVVGQNDRVGGIAGIAYPTAAGNVSQFVAVWEANGDVYRRVWSQTGGVGSAALVESDPLVAARVPRIGSGASEFTVAYGVADSLGAITQIRGARLLADGSVAVADRVVGTFGYPETCWDIRVASRPASPSSKRNTTTVCWLRSTPSFQSVYAQAFEPVMGFTTSFPVDCPSAAGITASLQPYGGDPVAGNEDFGLRLSSAPANTIAVLAISDVLPPVVQIPGTGPGCLAWIGGPMLYTAAQLTSGTGEVEFGLPIPGSLVHNLVLGCQALIATPGYNPLGWIVSNDIDIRWAH